MLRILAVLSLSASLVFSADPYWVSPTGAAAWGAAQSATPLSGTACASLNTANTNVVAGDTVKLRGGTYETSIYIDSTSGTSGSRITFEAHTAEVPDIRNVSDIRATYAYGIRVFDGSDYITIRGVTVTAQIPSSGNGIRMLSVNNGCDFLELDSCTFDGSAATAETARPLFTPVVNANGGSGCTHGWVHDCTFHDMGYINSDGDDVGGGLHIGSPGDASATQSCDNWTVEGCVMYYGAHHVLESFGQFNVIRNNRMWNELWIDNPNDPLGVGQLEPDPGPVTGKYGNRCIQLEGYNDQDPETDRFCLVEGNRLTGSGPPSDDNGDSMLTISSGDNLVRFNTVSASTGRGVYFKDGDDADGNAFYNNTVYYTGRRPANRTGISQEAVGLSSFPSSGFGNELVNNLIYDGITVAIQRTGGSNDVDDANTVVRGNWISTKDGNGDYTFDTTDPLFIYGTIPVDRSSQSQPNLSLQESSGAVDNGSYLTQASGSGSASVALTVDNAMFFQDGSWGSSLSSIQADWIAVGTVGNVVQVSAINYGTNVITLAAPMTWSDNDNIWLYKDSEGTRVLHGSAPDQGAFEYSITGTLTTTTLTVGP